MAFINPVIQVVVKKNQTNIFLHRIENLFLQTFASKLVSPLSDFLAYSLYIFYLFHFDAYLMFSVRMK